MKKTFITIFLPYYNDEKFLAITISSILNQTYERFELILFNHASTDSSREIAHSFKDSRIKHYDAEENLGAGSGLNSYNLLNQMHGEYIKFFCADDVMEPDCLEVMVDYLEKHKEIGFVFSDTYIIDENGHRKKQLWSEEKSEIGFSLDMNEKEILKLLFMRHSPIPFPAVLIRKSLLKPEFLDKSFIHLFDVNLWANLIIAGAKVKVIPKPLILYRRNKNQITSVFRDLGSVQATGFEVISAQNTYYKIKDYELLKAICNESPFINKITPNEVWAFEFIIAHYMLSSILGTKFAERFASYWNSIQNNAYLKIHDLLEDDLMRAKLKNRFDFGIKEFRALYTITDKNKKYTNKEKIFHLYKGPKELNFIDLSFLMIRQLYNLLTLRTLKDFIKNAKNQT